MNVWIVLGIVLGVSVLIPLVVYFSMKLGTLGFLRGKQSYHQLYDERQNDGKNETT